MALRSEQSRFSEELDRLVAVFGYTVSDREDLDRYLREHTGVLPLLHEAAREIPRYFPSEAHRTLRVFHDQEWGDTGPLFVTITWPHTATADAQSRLTSFEDKWWIPRAIETKTGEAVVFDVA
jgi:hypothetical protein